jgi:hypothetical protein
MNIKVEFVERQFARAMASGGARADAAQNANASDVRAVAAELRAALGSAFESAIDAHEKVLLGERDATSMLARFLASVRAAGGDVAAAYVAFDARMGAERQALAGFFAAAAELGTYLGALLGVLTVIVAMYVVYVLPAFANLYRGLDQRLPALTSTLLGNGPVIFVALVVILASGVVVGWGFTRARRRMLSLETLPRSWERLPAFGTAIAKHRIALAYGLQEMFLRAGVAVGVARADAERLTGGSLLVRPDEAAVLDAAQRVGALEDELRVQAEQRRVEALAALLRARRIAFHAARFLVYAVIALFVFGMYLPVFDLGAVID